MKLSELKPNMTISKEGATELFSEISKTHSVYQQVLDNGVVKCRVRRVLEINVGEFPAAKEVREEPIEFFIESDELIFSR